jgi:hypothetical protein
VIPACKRQQGAAHFVAELREVLAPRGIEAEIIVSPGERAC